MRPDLFNAFSSYLRNNTDESVENSKKKPDKFLDGNPDELSVYVGHNGKTLLDWLRAPCVRNSFK